MENLNIKVNKNIPEDILNMKLKEMKIILLCMNIDAKRRRT